MISRLMANLGLKLISLLVAVVLWFIVMGSRSDEVTKEVPIELITPQDLVVSNELPERIAFRISGPKAFIRNILNNKDEPIRINLTQAKAGLVTYRFLSDHIQLPIGVKVLSINPTAIIAKLEPLKRKEVPIKLVSKNETSEGFRLAKMELLKPTVKIKGAESRIEQITEAQTMPIDLSQMRASGEKDLAIDLTKMPGILIEGENPKVYFEIEQSSANFKIRNADVKVLTNRKFSLDHKEVTIYVRCSPEELNRLDRSKVFAIADLKNKAAGTYDTPLSVQLPFPVKLIKVLPSKVKVTLQ